MASHAVADGAHTPGIGRHVPAERAALLARRHRVDEPERYQLTIELFQRHAWFDHCHLVLGIDLHNPSHAVEGEQDAVRHGHGSSGEPGAAATRHDRDAVLAGQSQYLGHFISRGGHDDGQWNDRHGRQGLVVRVVGVHGGAGEHVALADSLAQLL